MVLKLGETRRGSTRQERSRLSSAGPAMHSTGLRTSQLLCMSDEKTLGEEERLRKEYGREGRSRDRRVVETRRRTAKGTEVQISTNGLV
jgi:hypothetical protein